MNYTCIKYRLIFHHRFLIRKYRINKLLTCEKIKLTKEYPFNKKRDKKNKMKYIVNKPQKKKDFFKNYKESCKLNKLTN